MEADADSGRARSRSGAWASAAIMAATLLGCLLRIAMARGDLWLDEVWSLDMVGPLRTSAEVFYGISHDNNHFLNSLWLFWLGQDRPPWAYRAPAVALGTLTVPLAAATSWRYSRAGGVCAAALAATALPFVIFGSEARGYAGMIAASFVAIGAFDAALAAPAVSPAADRAKWILGAAIGLGALFHLTMLGLAAALGLSAFLLFARDRSLVRALDATLDLLRPALLCLIPAMAAVLAGILHVGGFQLGGQVPASLGGLARGYGDQFRFALGLPRGIPAAVCLACGLLLALAAVRKASLSEARKNLLLAALVALPLGMLAFQLPNLAMARYYLVPGIVLLLAVADLLGALWDRGGLGSCTAALLLITLLLVGQGIADASALSLSRGRYGDALATMADPRGQVSYATPKTFWFESVAAHAARARHLTLHRVPMADLCAHPPEWFVDIPPDLDGPAPATIDIGPPLCHTAYGLRITMKPNPLSGMTWHVFRRLD